MPPCCYGLHALALGARLGAGGAESVDTGPVMAGLPSASAPALLVFARQEDAWADRLP
jgi:hypothetical protein